MQKIPATVVTGFLGAGKTTLIRHLLRTANGRRLALVVNEFGDIGIDGDLLRACGDGDCRDEDVIELANGCLCCTVADDFLPAIEALLNRPEPPDHIVIETSGLALPKPLLKAFAWPEVRTRVTVDGVVTVVDSAAVAAGRFAPDPQAVAAQRAGDPSLDHDSPLEELFQDQLACADLVILNKSDLIGDDERRQVAQEVATRARPTIKTVAATRGTVDAAVLLGLGVAAEDDLASRPSHADDEEEHDHEDFASFSLNLGEIASPEALQARVRAALATPDVFRVKGFAAVSGKPMRLVVQAVGDRVETYYDREWRPGEARSTRLVVIGAAGLDRNAIGASLGAGIAG